MARRDYIETNIMDGGAAVFDASTFFKMGLDCCIGHSAESDLVEAHKWFNIAALRGNLDARRLRSEISSEMTRQQIARAQRLAREWLARH